MDDEFALCWNNFQENIASGFQNLFDRGDLVDVTLACDGKLLQAHKIVLAICSPYFQEMFITNPCRHPIIVLKDVTYTVMTELMQFMYQGVVNVKHTELNSFMKIAQALQIKGLATSSSNQQQQQQHHHHQSHHHLQKSPNNSLLASVGSGANSTKLDSYANAASLFHATPLLGQKRSLVDYGSSNSGGPSGETASSARKHLKRSTDSVDNDISTESIDNMSSDEGFPIPQISMVESSRFDLSNVKREASEPLSSPSSARNLSAPFNFEYNSAYNKNNEYSNELHLNSNDLLKGTGSNCSTTGAGSSSGANAANANHMDIPTGGNITMLSSTSLLHGNCIFNRNNTVATQQGMKTYWLCKSYRITMCRARCITHQGRVISATGMHNHQPHMKGSYPNCEFSAQSGNGTSASNNGNSISVSMRLPTLLPPHQSSSTHQTATHSTANESPTPSPHNMHHQHQQQTQPNTNNQMHANSASDSQQSNQHRAMSPALSQHHLEHATASVSNANSSVSLQNMMQNVLSQNNLMHLTNIPPILNPMQHHSNIPPTLTNSSALHITPILGIGNNSNGQNLNSPNSPRSSLQHHSHQNHHQHNIHHSSHPHLQPDHGHAHHTHQESHSNQQDTMHHHHSSNSVVDNTTKPHSPRLQRSQSSQQQHSHNLSPSAMHHTPISPESNIMPLNSISSTSFKMEQL